MTNIIPIERAHAKLSASGSKKWLTCTRSAALEDQFPDEQSRFAAEGTFAHEVFELGMRVTTGEISVKQHRAKLESLKKNSYWSADLQDHVNAALAVADKAVHEARQRCKDPVILVEKRLDFSTWVPEGFGTGDLVIVTDDLVEVMDLKYGKGIPVECEGNTQMQLYGLGAYNELAHLYDIKRVRMTVLQPRLDNWGSSEMRVEDLLEWAEKTVAPRAQLAWDGEGDFAPGDHCTSGFCRARFLCPARAEAALEVAKNDFALKAPELLTQEQLVGVLAKADMAIDWLNDVKSYALKQAESGQEIPGYKLVEGRSNRKYSDADAVAERLIQSGVDEAVIYERSLLGITAMEKAIGKKKFAEVLGDLVTKPPGKPTLVQVEDKRPALSSVASAAEDFQ
jgi:hypothetical protein